MSWSLVVGLVIIVLTAGPWSNGFLFKKHEVVSSHNCSTAALDLTLVFQLYAILTNLSVPVFNWIWRCGTTMSHIVAIVGETLEKWYRDVGVAFLLFCDEYLGRG